jgi:hypothetical protein
MAAQAAVSFPGMTPDPDMREALANAARRYGLKVNLPSKAVLQSNQINIDTATITPKEKFSLILDFAWGAF